MEGLPFNELIGWVQRIFYAGFVGSGRFMGFAVFFPLFSWIQLRGVLRNGVIVALSLPNIAVIYLNLGDAPIPGLFQTIPLIIKEVAIGIVFGMLLGLPFWAAQMAGDVTDAFRGASAANLFDPVNSNEVSVTGTFLVLYSLAIFVLIGGIPLLVDMMMRSFAVWPSTTLFVDINQAAFIDFAGVAGRALMMALIMAAPLLISLAFADLAIIFATRSGKSFPIYDLINTFHNMIFILVLPFFALLFMEHYPPVLRTLFNDVANILPSVVK